MNFKDVFEYGKKQAEDVKKGISPKVTFPFLGKEIFDISHDPEGQNVFTLEKAVQYYGIGNLLYFKEQIEEPKVILFPVPAKVLNFMNRLLTMDTNEIYETYGLSDQICFYSSVVGGKILKLFLHEDHGYPCAKLTMKEDGKLISFGYCSFLKETWGNKKYKIRIVPKVAREAESENIYRKILILPHELMESLLSEDIHFHKDISFSDGVVANYEIFSDKIPYVKITFPGYSVIDTNITGTWKYGKYEITAKWNC